MGLIFGFLVIFLTYPNEARAQADPFYKGKTIRIIIGSTPGGFYDRWARLFARYMGKYIPGQPEIVAQNMPGAGSVIATNHVFGVAKPDGLTIGMPLNRRFAQIVLAAGDFGRPMIVTPGTPPERIKLLRDAFAKTLNDPEVLDEAKKARMDVEPTPGEELEALVKEIFDAPPDVLDRVKKMLAS
jgi:tripartite-type tricarboxylate transporter receptor subunit TctC